ncbi:alpha/beta hydrolase [Nostoc sp. CHAB 5844]|nr:alpha/beta hydrolase [Nostoc sp. CHAB 5844]
MEAKIVDIGDAQLSVYDAGSGEDIVFLHGNAGRWQHWEPQLRAFSHRFRCIAIDQRGFGASSSLTSPNSLSRLADDAAQVCQVLGVDHSYFVGLSMGGAVAQAIALRYPNLVDGLVLACPPLIPLKLVELPQITAEYIRNNVIANFGPKIKQQPQLFERLLKEHLETRIETLQNFSTHDFLQMDVTGIHAPVQVIAGELDTTAPPATLKQLAQKIPNATYLEFAETGHYPNIEQPEAFNAAIVHFIAEHPPRHSQLP